MKDEYAQVVREFNETLSWLHDGKVDRSVFRYRVADGSYFDHVTKWGSQPWSEVDGGANDAITDWFESLPLNIISTIDDVPMIPSWPDNSYSRAIRNAVVEFAKTRISL